MEEAAFSINLLDQCSMEVDINSREIFGVSGFNIKGSALHLNCKEFDRKSTYQEYSHRMRPSKHDISEKPLNKVTTHLDIL
ncbi:CLUMA_CG001931, isoform A [Clunio marinus]|uniref:CLUMA_CG001931, isoform A n=1 Tax=Clunio marinus TaxID=568069 RepID=A0A1J1HKT3_9DIPT|nr:CLUMA_CG001931, isoform A [Clunio marinus]